MGQASQYSSGTNGPVWPAVAAVLSQGGSKEISIFLDINCNKCQAFQWVTTLNVTVVVLFQKINHLLIEFQ